MPIAHGILLVTLAAGLLISSDRVSAKDAQHPSVMHLSGVGQTLDADLLVICPQGSAAEPQFQNQETGKIFAISDPRLRAIAEKACHPGSLERQKPVMSIS
jgi:hypothetical protein